jgi:hypothetical protein
LCICYAIRAFHISGPAEIAEGKLRTPHQRRSENYKSEKFVEADQSDLPSPVPPAKIFLFAFHPNHVISIAVSFLPKRGARDRHGRWERDAVDANARWTKRADADGEVVWF